MDTPKFKLGETSTSVLWRKSSDLRVTFDILVIKVHTSMRWHAHCRCHRLNKLLSPNPSVKPEEEAASITDSEIELLSPDHHSDSDSYINIQKGDLEGHHSNRVRTISGASETLHTTMKELSVLSPSSKRGERRDSVRSRQSEKRGAKLNAARAVSCITDPGLTSATTPSPASPLTTPDNMPSASTEDNSTLTLNAAASESGNLTKTAPIGVQTVGQVERGETGSTVKRSNNSRRSRGGRGRGKIKSKNGAPVGSDNPQLQHQQQQQPQQQQQQQTQQQDRQPEVEDEEEEEESRPTPEEIYRKGDPVITLLAVKEGEGSDASDLIARQLFLVPQPLVITSLVPIPGGSRIELADQASAGVVTACLEKAGWTVTSQDVWSRYAFYVPNQLSGKGPNDVGLDPHTIVRGLMLRNVAHGLPCSSLRHVSNTWETVEVQQPEGGGLSVGSRQRQRIWVEVSPEGETFLEGHSFLLETLVAAVRLRPAPRHSARTKRS